MDEMKAGIAIGLVLGFISGITIAAWVSNEWRSEAVKNGHAEYVLQGDQAVWRWKEAPINKEPR